MPILNAGQRHKVTLTLNGHKRSGFVEPRMLLSDFLRHEIGATGTHVGCEHGVCGACTVKLDGEPVRACLTLAVQVEGRRVDTVEGLGESDGRLGILQSCFRRHHALQCGFCTAGILMSLDAYLGANPDANEGELRVLLSGHICRCTGYTPIIAAALEAAELLRDASKSAGEA
ncbi:MAG: (2Fe-2S)-binding protein [Hyphomicrobiaceae bacterium]